MTSPERELREAVTAKADEWEREYAVDSPEIRKARLQCATELRKLLAAAPAPTPAPPTEKCPNCGLVWRDETPYCHTPGCGHYFGVAPAEPAVEEGGKT